MSFCHSENLRTRCGCFWKTSYSLNRFGQLPWTARICRTSIALGAPASDRSPERMLARLERADADLHRVFDDIRKRGAWDDTFVDARCDPPETFTFGGVFAHIITFNAHRRLAALHALRRLRVAAQGFGDPIEFEEAIAPWKDGSPAT